MNVIELKETLKLHKEKLDSLFVKNLNVFGPVARGEAKVTSDIDLIVEFSTDVDLFEFLDVKYFLEEILKCEVDLATSKSLHPALQDKILREAKRVA